MSEHANRISAKVIAQRYGADPAAVARDGVLYAKAHHVDVVLIDTAGRMQTNQNLMEEMGKIVRVVTPDLKIFIGDSLAGNDAISQAQLFSKYTGFDGAILTKADADTKGGAALSICFTTKRPILFLGSGRSTRTSRGSTPSRSWTPSSHESRGRRPLGPSQLHDLERELPASPSIFSLCGPSPSSRPRRGWGTLRSSG